MAGDSEHQAAEAKAGSEQDEAEARVAEVAAAIEELRAPRRTTGKAPLDGILASRHEGHKY